MSIVQAFYTALFISSYALFVFLLMTYKKRLSIWYVLSFCCALVSCFGYMQLASADGLMSALFANQTVYLGSCFSPFFIFMCIADLCKVNIKKVYQGLLLAYSILVFTFISSSGAISWYYSKVYFEIKNGAGILVKEYGPLHLLYPIYLVIILTCSLSVIIGSFKRRSYVSYKNSIMLMGILVVITLVYTVEKLMGWDTEFVPMAYVWGQIVIIILLRRISLYDVAAISTDRMVQSAQYGFVMFDNRGRYLGADEAAKNWFPETATWKIDSEVVDDGSSKLLTQIKHWLEHEHDENSEDEKAYIKTGDTIIEAIHDKLREGKRTKVNLIYLRDETSQYEYTKLVEKFNEKLEKDVRSKTDKLRRVQNDIIISMASIVENRDNNTGGHIARTSDVVRIFMEYLKNECNHRDISDHKEESIIKAAPLHDFGKIGIPDRILNKPGRFTDEEYEQMKEHSAKGAVIVEKILRNSEDKAFKKIAINIAHYHHEKWDGTGYPCGLKGEEIPFEARVMALADVFDALVSKRVYKESMSYDQAFEIIEESCGTHFDPHLCKDFLNCRKKIEELYDSYTD